MPDITTLPFPVMVLLLAVLAFLQNMTFTWSSRSRNAGDTKEHRKASYCSNSVWFFTQVLMFGALFSTLTKGSWWQIVVVGIVYTLSTSEGSVAMMKRLLRTETGKRQVGAR